MKKGFWSILFVLALMFSVSSMQANAATVNNAKDYIPSLGIQYEMSFNGANSTMSIACQDIHHSEQGYTSRACNVKNGYEGVTYFNDKSKWRPTASGSDWDLTDYYYFPMTAGKTYKKTVEGPDGEYTYSYKVESVNSKLKVGNKTYTNVIKIKNEKGGYTYIAKNHGAIFISSKRDSKVVTDFKVMDYKKITTATKKKYTTKAAVNVRTGASTKYKVVGTLKKGTAVTVKGTSGSWYKISYKGKIRYVSKSYIKVTTVAKKPATSVTKKYTTKVAVNVRTGASMKYKKVGTLKKGTTLTVKGTSGSWYKISYKGKIRYVSKSNVKVTTVAKKPATSATKKYTTTASLYVRAGASTKSKSLGTLKKGATVVVKGTSGSWYKITYKGKTGYVSKSYVKVMTTTVAKKPEQPKVFSYFETTNELNIRKGAGTGYQLLDILNKGALVKVEGQSGSWSKITYDGKTGYVSTKYLTSTTQTFDSSIATDLKREYAVGEYTVGETIPEGEYKLYSMDYSLADVSLDRANGEMVVRDTFRNTNYITIEKGMKLQLKNAYAIPIQYAVPASIIVGDDMYEPGTYKVGFDLPAGYYVIFSIEERDAFVSKSTKVNAVHLAPASRFQGKDFLTLEKGSYIRLDHGFLQYTGID